MKTRPNLISALTMLLIAVGLVFGTVACEQKKEEDKKEEKANSEGAENAEDGAKGEGEEAAEDEDAAEGEEAADGEQGAMAEEDSAAEEGVDEYIKFHIMHTEEAKGPVDGSFGKFEVKEAVVDLENLNNSTATYEVDLSSIDTGNPKRDDHLRSGDFFGVDNFPTATFTIKDVQPENDEGKYKATAVLAIRELKKEVPVEFEIVEKKDDGSIVVEGEAKLSRQELTVGGPPNESGAQDEVTLSVRLHLAS